LVRVFRCFFMAGVAPVAGDKTQTRRSPARNIGRLPKHLSRYDEVIEPESKTCPCCSFELHCIGTDVSEALANCRRRRTNPWPIVDACAQAESRSAREVEGQLSSFAGVLQVDGYQAYKTMAKRRGTSNVAPKRLAFCLAHARRKFVDVVKLTGSSEALSILARIA